MAAGREKKEYPVRGGSSTEVNTDSSAGWKNGSWPLLFSIMCLSFSISLKRKLHLKECSVRKSLARAWRRGRDKR